ncbi:MAG: DNA gyrase subunit A [Bacilli bacterium]
MDKLLQRNIVEEVENCFIKYSMSVIVSRALPDLRDGLKPVHRRILYTMYEDGLTPDKPFRKSATTVGSVLGRYHPHGDSSVYDAMVRTAQDFSYRYVLVDGHGNFGSIDGDDPAAYRYTEARLSKISLELLRDINKNTVDFGLNYDGTRKEPLVLPSKFPNIIVNGTMGIAVGMATNIPPHNLSEVIDGCVAYIDNNDITTLELMEFIKGPDFPTAATILGNSGIKKAYDTGKGTITIRGKAEIDQSNGKNRIIIKELPYQVNKRTFQERIGELVRNKTLEGITNLHDESSLTNGIKVVVTLKKDANANVILNNLYKHTQLQTSYGITFLMIDEGEPKTLPLKDIISKYINYQKLVIIRRTQFELDKALKRVHILEGYKIAIDNIDEVIKIIKEANNDSLAKERIMSRFNLSDTQADAILELKLRRLTGLERAKIEEELNDLLKEIARYREILASEKLVLDIIKQEMLEIKAKFGDKRKTEIDMTAVDFIEDESLIPEENILIVLTNKGYIKRTTSDTFKSQNRGGVGIKGIQTNDEDFVEHMINLSTHDYILFFTNKGKVYRLKGYEIPEFGRQSKGLPIINLLQIDKDEKINSVVRISQDDDSKYLLFATRGGVVKRTLVSEFDSIRGTGKISITLKENDELIDVKKTDGKGLVLLASDHGRMVKFDESQIRTMGRTASGVRGISLDGSNCICCEIVDEEQVILLVTEKGYGKQTKVCEYRKTKRGSKGVKALNITEKNGILVSVKVIEENKELVIMTNSGMTMRMPLEQISVLGRVTQGVRLINLKDEQTVATISLVDIVEEPEENEEESIIEGTSEDKVIDPLEESTETITTTTDDTTEDEL